MNSRTCKLDQEEESSNPSVEPNMSQHSNPCTKTEDIEEGTVIVAKTQEESWKYTLISLRLKSITNGWLSSELSETADVDKLDIDFIVERLNILDLFLEMKGWLLTNSLSFTWRLLHSEMSRTSEFSRVPREPEL